MNTGQATETLAEIYPTGDADSKTERAAEGQLWTAAQHAEACEWSQAGYSLDAAYHALGAEPPEATATDFERGRHAIQIEADRRHLEEMGARENLATSQERRVREVVQERTRPLPWAHRDKSHHQMG
jgi:hypothetical protein